MPIFDTDRSGRMTFTRGNLSNSRGNPGTIKQAVTDGDTIRVTLPGGQGLRMLGCDTPEKKIEFITGGFISLDDDRWKNYFDTLWDNGKWGKFKTALPAPLKSHLKKRMKADLVANHFGKAVAATNALAALLKEDMTALGLTEDKLRMFAVFAHEILDRYGRPLVFVAADVKAAKDRREIYNVRMIANGQASPFFMWPNIEPFRKWKVTEAALPPEELREQVRASRKLQSARALAAEARAAGLGIYDGTDPLQLHAFELRFLARRAAPDRWVIDISDSASGSQLIEPGRYFDVPNCEDRLYIPAEYVPLFRSRGWT